MKILIAEDDLALADVVRRGLSESGHVVDHETDGREAEDAALENGYDAIVLDIMLPSKSGLEVARALRQAGNGTPILMLTARDQVADVIAGIDAGADDYLRKPFVFDELEARLRSLARRRPTPPSEVMQVADVEMNLASRTVTRSGRRIALSARETAFLEFFMRHAGTLLTRSMLEDALWERDRYTASNIIEVYVRRLRKKLCENGEPELIHTVRRGGYRFGPPPP